MSRRVGDALKRGRSGRGKLHRKTAGTEVMPELLAEQHFHIRLVVDHENEKVHARSPHPASAAPAISAIDFRSMPRSASRVMSVRLPLCEDAPAMPASA